MLVSDIITRVQRLFGDEAGVQLTTDDITRFINDGVRTIVSRNEGLLQAIATQNSVAGQGDYVVPADLLILRKCLWKDTGDTAYLNIQFMSFNQFNELIDGWDGTSYPKSAPVAYTFWQDTIKVFPFPAVSTSAALKIYYNRKPVDVVLASDTPDIPVIYHETLVKYVMTQAYEMDEDVDSTTMKQRDFDNSLNFLRGRTEWHNEDTYPVITVRQEDQF